MVSTITKCVFIPTPTPACLVWLCFCHAFGLHCPVPEVSFPSAPPILSFGIVLSPAQRRSTGHSVSILMGVVGLWHLLRRIIYSCMESVKVVAISPTMPWSMLFSQAVARKARIVPLHPEMTDGAVSERKWPVSGMLASVRQRRHHHVPFILCFTALFWGSGFWAWRMRTHYLTISPFSDPHTSYRCESTRLAAGSVKPSGTSH